MGSAPSAFPPGITFREAKRICNGNDLFKIVQLASHSAATEDFVRRRKIRNITGIEAVFAKGGDNKIIVTWNEQRYSFTISETSDMESCGRVSVQDRHNSCYTTKKSKCVVGDVSKLFMSFFHESQLANVNFNDPNRDIRDLTNFEHIFNAKQITISKPTVSPEELSFVASKFPKPDRVRFHTTPPKEFHTWPLRYPNVQIVNDVPLSGALLAKMTCVKLELCNSEMSTTQINAFFKLWKEGSALMNAERVIFRHFENKRDLYTGLKNQMWNPKNRDQYYRLNSKTKYDAGKCVDITREDGVLASITFEPDRSFCMLLVWRDRFPDTDGLTVSDY